MFRHASIVTTLALLVTGTALAQTDSRIKPLDAGKRAPADVIRGVEADSIRSAVEGRLEIVDASPAHVLSKRRVRQKDVGDAVRYNVRYEITVHNPGNAAKQFRIMTEVAGEPRARSALFEVLPGQRIQRSQTVMFVLPALGLAGTLGVLDPNSRPVRVRIVDAAGRELAATNIALD